MSGKTLKEIAELVAGTLSNASEMLIFGATNIEEASEREITFAVPPHIEKAAKSKAGAVIIPRGMDFPSDKPVIEVENPRVAFATLLELFQPPLEIERKIHPLAHVAESAVIGKDVAVLPFAVIAENAIIGDGSIVYPHVYIGRNVKIGENSVFHANCSVYDNCVIGDNVIIHSGAVVGGDGFGYVEISRQHHKVPQVGNVVIGDNVEIGCNSCVDRGTTGSTIVGKGTKIDNLVHIGHNDVIGENCILIAFVGLPGSVKVGDNVTFAGQAATVGHITIGDNCVFAGRAGVISDVPSNSVYAGFPAQPHKDWLKKEAMQRKIPGLLKKLQQLEDKINQLENK